MKLKELLKEIYHVEFNGVDYDREIASICSDSRIAQKGSLFVALKGAAFDGFDFVDEAIERGASVIVVGSDYSKNNKKNENVCYLEVKEPRSFMKKIIKRFYNDPSSIVKTVGVTGTNGKTTTTYLIEAILNQADKSCGVMGSINYRVGNRISTSRRTTPDIVENHQFLAELVDEGIDYCVMEVSSHALDQGRVDLINFKGAIFTNLTNDHLDYHKTKEEYFSCKSLLFKNLSPESVSVINIDDQYGCKLCSLTESRIITYGIEKNAQVMAKDIQLTLSGTQFKIISEFGEALLRTKLVGLYNVYNILGAVSFCLSEGIGLDKIKQSIERFNFVPGRLESLELGQDFTILIDYAHTADALQNVLSALKKTSDARIILVFGCGGNRDKTKRPEMGAIAGQLADYCIVTTDNPRNEDPIEIIKEIERGFESDNYCIIVEREAAIAKALEIAKSGDIVLIAGKGHEDYQVFGDRNIKFNEKAIIRQHLRC